MSVSRRLEARIEYRCDICGAVGIWTDDSGWRRYGSYLLDETVPAEEIPHACSDKCARELEHRVETGVIVLPTLRVRSGGFAIVTKPGRGYGPFLHQNGKYNVTQQEKQK